MTLVTYASFLTLFVTVGWSIALLVRLRDPRLRALTALLSAVALSRIAVLLDPSGSWTVDISLPVEELPAFGISILAVLVLSLLDQTLSRASVALRTIHDTVTGLPNRNHFVDLLDRTLKRRPWHHEPFSVMLFDIDRFQRVNASHGQTGGDQLLLALSQRLLKCVRPEDTVARIGSDGFGLLLAVVKDSKDATRVAERIWKQLQTPFQIRDRNVFVTGSIGIVSSETGYEDSEDILRDAETAMGRAKSSGGGTYEFFDSAMHQRAVSLLQLEADIRAGLQQKQFRLVYQPLISLESGRISSLEALVRWEHPTRGLVSPAEFIPLAEETGLIVPLGGWVLREACRQAAAWRKMFPGMPKLSVSVNLSPRQFQQDDLLQDVTDILNEHELTDGGIAFEITEGVLMNDVESSIHVLTKLRELGTRLYIDDFGTGYSSLSYLHRLPFDVLKIDRSFISEIESRDVRAPIVNAVLGLAIDLGVDVVAEGVETTEQAEWLKARRCQYAQGYLFSKPVSAEAVTELLEAQAKPSSRPIAHQVMG